MARAITDTNKDVITGKCVGDQLPSKRANRRSIEKREK